MELGHHIVNPGELAHAQCACMLSAGKMAELMYGHQGRDRSISATEQF